MAAWINATVTLLEAGVLDGFRQGWRKSYVEFLDTNAAGLLLALAAGGGAVPSPRSTTAPGSRWLGPTPHEPDGTTERSHVVGWWGP